MADARPTTPPVLATHALTRHFGGLVAVRDVSISLHQGELHAVIGPNGAGKTTLVNMLSGEIQPTAGRIELDGREVAGEPAWRMTGPASAARSSAPTSSPRLPVLENVRLAVQAVSAAPSRPFRHASSETAPDRQGARRPAARRPGAAPPTASPAPSRTASSASSRSP